MSAPSIDPRGVDPRGPRLGAWLTSVVLAVVLLTGSAWLLAAQVVVFALGAAGRSPYGPLWRRVRRALSLGPPAELEDPRPLRFAQILGLVFATVGAVALATGLTGLGLLATAAALAAAFLNAAFGVCLGCLLYVFVTLKTTRTPTRGAPA